MDLGGINSTQITRTTHAQTNNIYQYTLTLSLSQILLFMLLWTLIAHSNYVCKHITILTLFSPRYYPLTPFTPVQPNLPSKVVTYAGNYRCVANY